MKTICAWILCLICTTINCLAADFWSSGYKLQSNICWGIIPPHSLLSTLRVQALPGDPECILAFYECINSLLCTNVTPITANFTNYTEVKTAPSVLTKGKKVLLYDYSANKYERAIVMGTNATGFHITNDNELVNIGFAMAHGDVVYPVTEKFRMIFGDAVLHTWSSGNQVGAGMLQTRGYPWLVEVTITNTAIVMTNLSLVIGGVTQ